MNENIANIKKFVENAKSVIDMIVRKLWMIKVFLLPNKSANAPVGISKTMEVIAWMLNIKATNVTESTTC
jgi:hypothetical protein